MASFSALLFVAGHSYPVRQCTYEFTQTVGPRGRVTERVRMGLVQLMLDVPADDFLPGWAATPNKPLAGQVVFLAAHGGSALETLGWEVGQCVGYREEFAAGDQEAGAYVCHLTIAAPKLTIQPGGPAAYSSSTVAAAPAAVAEAEVAAEVVAGAPEVVAEPTLGEMAVELGQALLEELAPLAAAVATPVLLTAGLIVASTTPTAANDTIPQALLAPVDPQKMRLQELEQKYAADTLTAEEEAELLALLAKVKGIHVQRLSDLPGTQLNGKVAIPIFTPLLPREGDVGTYKELIDAGSRGDNITPHHIPSDAYIKQHGIARNDGVCINMEQPGKGGRHRQTKTFGRNMTDSEREAYYKLSPLQALEYDVQDARRIFAEEGKLDAKMEQKLQEVIRQNKIKFPTLYR